MDFGNNNNMIPRQERADANAFNNNAMVTEMAGVWDLLIIQLSPFNRIVVIPALWYNSWNNAERIAILNFMV